MLSLTPSRMGIISTRFVKSKLSVFGVKTAGVSLGSEARSSEAFAPTATAEAASAASTARGLFGHEGGICLLENSYTSPDGRSFPGRRLSA